MPEILIAESNLLMAQYYKVIVESQGCAVCGVAGTTEEALALSEKRSPDLVLIDDQLAGDVDCIDLARKLVHALSLRVVLVTGLTESSIVTRIRSACPQADVLVKPVQPSELRRAFRTHCADVG